MRSLKEPFILDASHRHYRLQYMRQRADNIKRYDLDIMKAYLPADMPANIYRHDMRGIYWCYWNDWKAIYNKIWILTNNNYFVCVKHVGRSRGCVRVLTYNHGSYNSSDTRDKPFNLMTPMSRNPDDRKGYGRGDDVVDYGYRAGIQDMAKLIAYGCRLEDAHRIAFKDKNHKGADNMSASDIQLKAILRRPELLENLKVELKKAFEEKGINREWLIDRLKEIGENPAHKSQVEVLMLMARILNIDLDAYSGRRSLADGFGAPGMNVMGYASRQEVTDGRSTKSEAMLIGPPDSVKRALGQDE